jgi:hypothetical protein
VTELVAVGKLTGKLSMNDDQQETAALDFELERKLGNWEAHTKYGDGHRAAYKYLILKGLTGDSR